MGSKYTISWVTEQRCIKDREKKLKPYRSDFDRDYGRVTHSSSFRRLQGKTQVWGEGETDFFRNRLTHSLEVAQIGVGLSKIFNYYYRELYKIKNLHFSLIPENLIRTCCLAHDIGHPPLGHDGEVILNEFAKKMNKLDDADHMQVCFDGNAQNFRILTHLESPYPGRHGLNLTASVLDGITKYKSMAKQKPSKYGYYYEDEDVYKEMIRLTKTNSNRNPLAMLVELSDDIAYCSHDLQDGMRSGFITQRILHNWLENNEWMPTKDWFQDPKNSWCKPTAIEKESAKLLNEFNHWIKEGIGIKKNLNSLDRHEFRTFQKVFLSNCIHDLIEKVANTLKKEENLKRLIKVNYVIDKQKKEKYNLVLDKNRPLQLRLMCFKSLAKTKIFENPNLIFKKATGRALLENYLERFSDLIYKSGDKLKADFMFKALPKSFQNDLKEAKVPRERLRTVLDYVSGMTDDFFMTQASAFYDPKAIKALGYPF